MRTLNEYNESKFNGLFLLKNDNDFADVIFMYTSFNDVMEGDMHYIKSHDYNGYVECCGKGCPACGRGIRIQTKLPIPIYNITEDQLQIWDRNISFQYQLSNDVFANYPNPSEVIFRVTRHGVPGDINTKYEINARGMNQSKETNAPMYNLSEILKNNNTTVKQMYQNFCREYSIEELEEVLPDTANSNNSGTIASELPDYKVTPRNFNATNTDSPVDDFMNIPDGADEEFTEF